MPSTIFQIPPLDHSLLFPDLVNFHMERNPSFPMFVYTSETIPSTLVEISFLEFGRAAHRIAHSLRPSRQGADGEVVMIIANVDTILYHAVVAGLSIAGWVPFPVSPRNSVAAIVNMMKKTRCSHIVTLDHSHKILVDGIHCEIEAQSLTVHEIPTLLYAFPKLGEEIATDSFVPYPFPLIHPSLDTPAIYIHSSGSTGFPKPIAHTHRVQIQWMTRPVLREDAKLRSPRRIGTMAAPPFHAFGIITQLYAPIVSLITSVVNPPRMGMNPLAQPMVSTSDNMIDCLKKIECNVLWTVPTFLEHMATSDEAIEVLKKMEYVRFGGGPLPVKVGEKLWRAGVRLSSAYGGTEFGAPIALTSEQDVVGADWTWLRFHDGLGIRWAPQGDNTYELQVLSTKDYQTAIENLPDVRGYATADIFMKHPTENIWKVVGRADDIIMLASGEKTTPGPMESIISSSPLVQGAVMFGRERNQVGVLIEPRPGYSIDVKDEKAVAEFRNQIWPVIEEANKPSPAFSRIFKEMILVTSQDKPMSRAAKGTVQRKATLSAYETEINKLYDTVEASSVVPNGLAGPSAWTTGVLEMWLLEHVRAISPSRHVNPTTDLFAQGFDSLSVTHLRNRILGALRNSADPEIKTAATRIPLNVIFENPTIRLLSSRIAALVDNNSESQVMDSVEHRRRAINAIIKRYSVGLDGSRPVQPAVVLLTGTTGGLGSFLLAELLKSPMVERVFAFNRPWSEKSIEERQMSAFRDRGLSISLLDSNKLVYVEADASLDKCGLSPAQYEEIRNSITMIIHNAWRLDFNLAIASFEENIRASRNLVDLGRDSPRNETLRFLFTSSVGSAQSWDNSNGPFPEEVQLDPTAAIGAGYGEGKYVTERIIVQSGLHATSLRIGQIAGGAGGSWATTDWFPIIVKSSIALGVLPEAAGVVSWLREEEVTSAIVEMAFSKEAPPPAINIVNPRSTPWADIMAFVRRSIIERKGLEEESLPIIPFADWFALVESKAQNPSKDNLEKIPAIKLLDFLRILANGDETIRQFKDGDLTEAAGMRNFSTRKAQRLSPTMANMQAIGEDEADAWVGYWISKGAF